MNPSTSDTGVISAMMTGLERQQLPRVFALKDKVDDGELLGDFDIGFLEEVIGETRNIEPLVERHPEYRLLMSRTYHLFYEVTRKALDNEQHYG